MVCCIGEAIADLVASSSVPRLFTAVPGGAPANCAAAVASLGGESMFVGKVGNDYFGRMIRESLLDSGVDCSRMLLSERHRTSLSVVTLDESGDRSFEFMRDENSADLMLFPEELPGFRLTSEDTLCFGSCCLMSAPFRSTLSRALKQARSAGAIIAMDVNLRPAMWESRESMIRTIADFIAYADIVKMSGDEFCQVTGEPDEKKAAEHLLHRSASAVFISRGGAGASVYLPDGRSFLCPARRVDAVDTVGAGDAFTGAILYSCDGGGRDGLADQDMEMVLSFAVAAGTLSVTKRGGIPSMPDFDSVMKFVSGR